MPHRVEVGDNGNGDRTNSVQREEDDETT